LVRQPLTVDEPNYRTPFVDATAKFSNTFLSNRLNFSIRFYVCNVYAEDLIMTEENKQNKQRAQEKIKLIELYRQFNGRFPTIENVWCALLQPALVAMLIFCRECQSTNFIRKVGTRKGKCQRCGLWQSLTAGGYLSNTRRPRAWLFSLNLVAEKQFFSTELVHEVVGVSQSSAAHIFKTVGFAVGTKLDEDTEQVQSSVFKEVFCHRSRETPKDKHPAEEEKYFERSENESQADANVSLPSEGAAQDEVEALKSLFATLSESEQKIARLLSSTPVHADILTRDSGLSVPLTASSLTFLELAGVAARLAGDRYVLAETTVEKNAKLRNGAADANMNSELSQSQAEVLPLFLAFCRRIFSGLSRKWLHYYLAMFSCYLDEHKWDYAAISTACFEAGYIGGRRLLNYVSPRFVRLPIQASSI